MDTTAVLTGALVVITGYYAWQTYRMANEMQQTRRMAVLPSLGIKWNAVGPTMTFVRVVSLGPGAAMDVDVEVVFVPRDRDESEMRRRIQASVMAPGEAEDIMPTGGPGDGLMTTDDLVARFDRIELVGSLRDVTNAAFDVRDALPDLEEWQRVRREARIRWIHPDVERRFAKEVAEQMDRTSLKKIPAAVDALRAELSRHRPADPE